MKQQSSRQCNTSIVAIVVQSPSRVQLFVTPWNRMESPEINPTQIKMILDKVQRQFNWEQIVFSTNGLKQLDMHMQKNMNFDPYLAKWILNVKPKTIKLIEETWKKNHCNLGVGKDFLNIKSRIHERKSWQTGLKKTLAGDLRTHTFCPVRGEMKKRKRRQPNGVLKMNKIFWQMLHWRRHQMVLTRRSREGGMTQGHGKQ